MAQKRIAIKYMALEELITDAKNPRRNDNAVEPVMESIRNFGFRVPIVVDQNNVIRAGHTRYKAAKALNYTQVPCVVVDELNEKQLKAFQLGDNKTGELANWDIAMLDLEMASLETLFDMSRFGFSKKKDDSLIGGDSPSTSSTKGTKDVIVCPRCGRTFRKAEGHIKHENDNADEDLDYGDLEEGDLF